MKIKDFDFKMEEEMPVVIGMLYEDGDLWFAYKGYSSNIPRRYLEEYDIVNITTCFFFDNKKNKELPALCIDLSHSSKKD